MTCLWMLSWRMKDSSRFSAQEALVRKSGVVTGRPVSDNCSVPATVLLLYDTGGIQSVIIGRCSRPQLANLRASVDGISCPLPCPPRRVRCFRRRSFVGPEMTLRRRHLFYTRPMGTLFTRAWRSDSEVFNSKAALRGKTTRDCAIPLSMACAVIVCTSPRLSGGYRTVGIRARHDLHIVLCVMALGGGWSTIEHCDSADEFCFFR